MRADAILGAGGIVGAVGVAFAGAPRVGGPAFAVAGLLLVAAALKDVAGASNFKGKRRAMNAGIAVIGVIFLLIGIGLLAQ